MRVWPKIREGIITVWHALLDYDSKVPAWRREMKAKERAAAKAARLAVDAKYDALAAAGRMEVASAHAAAAAPPPLNRWPEQVDVLPPGWGGFGPTRKQIAYLQYLRVMETPTDRGTASEWIDKIHNEANQKTARGEVLSELCANWSWMKWVKHPDLYPEEDMRLELSRVADEMRAGVRRRIRGASGRLTIEKAVAVVRALWRENPNWLNGDRFPVFYSRLREMFPECCDGAAIPPRPKVAANQGSGCLVILLGIGSVIVTVALASV